MKNRLFDYLWTHAGGSVQTSERPASGDQGPTLMNKTMAGLHEVTPFIRNHPAATIGFAFALGVCLGWLHKRR